jgi:hypothetical protein
VPEYFSEGEWEPLPPRAAGLTPTVWRDLLGHVERRLNVSGI